MGWAGQAALPNNLIEKIQFGFFAGNVGLFKKRNYKYFEYKKVNFLCYFNSMILIKWFVMFNVF